MKAASIAIAMLFAVTLVACGTEIGEIPFDGVGTGETNIVVDGSKDVDFWTELEIDFQGEIRLG